MHALCVCFHSLPGTRTVYSFDIMLDANYFQVGEEKLGVYFHQTTQTLVQNALRVVLVV